MVNHETEDIVIKIASIDKGIVKLVKWLNSKQGVVTEWSCEGDKLAKDVERSLSYVSFTCYDLNNIMEVKRIVHEVGMVLSSDEEIDFSVNTKFTSWGIHTTYSIVMSQPSVVEKIEHLLS